MLRLRRRDTDGRDVPIEPNPSRLSPTNVLALAIAVVFVIVGLFAVAAPWVIRSRDLGIDENGSRAVGRVEAVSRPLTAGGDGEFTISYSFVAADGSTLRASRSVPEAYWHEAVVGQAVEVRYDPDRPADNHPAGFGGTSIGLAVFVTGIGGLIGCFGVVLGIALVRQRPDPALDHPG